MAFRKRKMRERGRKWYKERGKCIIESRIKFPDLTLMTLDTPHGPITKFLKKCPKFFFPPLWCLVQKLDHNSGLHAKNQREISKNEVRKPPTPTLCMEMWTFPFSKNEYIFEMPWSKAFQKYILSFFGHFLFCKHFYYITGFCKKIQVLQICKKIPEFKS